MLAIRIQQIVYISICTFSVLARSPLSRPNLRHAGNNGDPPHIHPHCTRRNACPPGPRALLYTRDSTEVIASSVTDLRREDSDLTLGKALALCARNPEKRRSVHGSCQSERQEQVGEVKLTHPWNALEHGRLEAGSSLSALRLLASRSFRGREQPAYVPLQSKRPAPMLTII